MPSPLMPSPSISPPCTTGDPSLRPDNFTYVFAVSAASTGGGSPIPVVSGFQGDAFIGSALVGFYLNFSKVFSENKMSRFAGSGVGGFLDGDAVSAKFDRPLCFAVDSRGNVYVADQMNHAIRKICSAGVTTIAGGYSKKAGHVDGSGQNATFSDDLDLTYIPKKCAMLIPDRGRGRYGQEERDTFPCSSPSIDRAPGLYHL